MNFFEAIHGDRLRGEGCQETMEVRTLWWSVVEMISSA